VLLSRFAAALRARKAAEAGREPQSPPPRPSVLLINGDSLEADGQGAFRVPGVQAVIRHIDHIACQVKPTATRVYETLGGRDLADFDLIHVVSHQLPTGMLLSAIAEHLDAHRRPLMNMADVGAPTRLMQMMRLARSGICVPRTVYLAPKKLAGSYAELVAELGSPFLLSRLVSYRAEAERLIGGEQEFADACRDSSPMVAQEYVPNRAVHRLLVLGGTVAHATSARTAYGPGADETSGPPDQLSNVRDLDPRAVRTAVLAAEAMEYEMSAVLLVQHSETQTWHVLDVQYSTGIGSGPFPEIEIAAYSTYLRRKLDTRSSFDPRASRGALGRVEA